MLERLRHSDAGNTSFLPDDYIAKKAERRTNLFALTLFTIVIFGVVGAFFVTNRQWATVKTQQESINIRYTEAAQQIQQLKQLESQKEQMLSKAELTTALIEKAPRSLLLADLINRMPERLALLEFDLTSKRLESASPRSAASTKPKSLAGRGSRTAKNKKDAEEEDPRPQAPRHTTSLVLIGVAPSHEDVSGYLAQLQNSQLLRSVDLKFSEFTMLDNRELIKFRIEASLNVDADARRIEPLVASRKDVFGPSVADAQPEEDN